MGFDSWDLYNVGEQNLYPGPVDNSGLFSGKTSILKGLFPLEKKRNTFVCVSACGFTRASLYIYYTRQIVRKGRKGKSHMAAK